MSEKRYRPFSNGSQWIDWQSNNCCGCSKAKFEKDSSDVASECPILLALFDAMWDDGTISAEIADRMTRDDGRYVWPCGEHDPPFMNVKDGKVTR